MRLLDLFCGAGGAAMGYSRAGFDEIVGIDINPQPNYPFHFVRGDALRPPVRLEDFDLIHASPPCQHYSTATADPSLHPDLVADVRLLLKHYPSVIENVIGAPLRPDVKLCGSMFGLEIRRHRIFELGEWFLFGAETCRRRCLDMEPWEVSGHAGGHRQAWEVNPQKTVRQHKKFRDTAHAKELMGMPWAQTTREVVEAIPPAYTEYIGRQFLDQQARSLPSA